LKKPNTSKNTSIKRTGRTKGVGELVSRLIDPALKKRGFASNEILENWLIIAPPPYNRTTIPDRLKWRRNKAGTQGALLYLRCAEGDRMALSHDHERISQAINRYFGYVLVDAIKLSNETFTEQAKEDLTSRQIKNTQNLSPEVSRQIDGAIKGVTDNEIKNALREFGQGLYGKKKP